MVRDHRETTAQESSCAGSMRDSILGLDPRRSAPTTKRNFDRVFRRLPGYAAARPSCFTSRRFPEEIDTRRLLL